MFIGLYYPRKDPYIKRPVLVQRKVRGFFSRLICVIQLGPQLFPYLLCCFCPTTALTSHLFGLLYLFFGFSHSVGIHPLLAEKSDQFEDVDPTSSFPHNPSGNDDEQLFVDKGAVKKTWLFVLYSSAFYCYLTRIILTHDWSVKDFCSKIAEVHTSIDAQVDPNVLVQHLGSPTSGVPAIYFDSSSFFRFPQVGELQGYCNT